MYRQADGFRKPASQPYRKVRLLSREEVLAAKALEQELTSMEQEQFEVYKDDEADYRRYLGVTL